MTTLVLLAPELARHAKKIAARCGCHVVPKRTPNPTLVAHGLVASARWHILTHEPPRKAVADLYVGTRPEAVRVAGALSRLLGQQLDLLDNTATPADLKAHPRTIVKRNPSRTAPSRGDVNRRVADLLAAARTAFERGDKVHAQRLYERAWEVGVGGHVSTNPSRSKAGRYLRAARRGKGRGVPRRAARAQFAAARGGSVAKFKHYMRDSGARYTRRAANPKRRNPAWKTGDRFRLTLPVTLERASYVKGATGTITLAERGNVYAVFDVTPHIAPQPVSSRWIAKTTNRRANPKGPNLKTRTSARVYKAAVRAGRRATARGAFPGNAAQAIHYLHDHLIRKYAGELKRRATLYHKHLLSHEAFTGSTERIWREIESKAPAVKAGVLKALRTANPGAPRIVYNKLLGGWYVVVGPHQTPLNGRFNSKYEAQAWLARRANPAKRIVAGGSSGARHQGLNTREQALHAERGLRTLGLKTAGVVKRGKRWHVVIANPKGRKSSLPFAVGDVVSISAVQYFGRHGTVVAVGTKLVTVEVHLIGKRVKFAPAYLRLVNGSTSPRVRTAANPKGRFTAKEMQTSAVGYYYKHQGESFGPFRTVAERDHHKRASGATVRRVRTLSPLAQRLAAKVEHELRTSSGRFAPSSKKGRKNPRAALSHPQVPGRASRRSGRAASRSRRTRKPTRRIPRGSVRTSPRAPYRRKARPSATGMRRHPNPSPVDQAAKVVRMFQDRGPIPVRRRTVKKPKPLGAAAALIGKVVAVTYDSPKFDGKKRHYEHTFDEPQPLLVADPETQDLSIVRASSRYRLTPDGIVN